MFQDTQGKFRGDFRMTDKERQSIARHQRQADKYRRLAEAHEQMVRVIEEDIDDWLFLEDIPHGQPVAWYREQAELYRAKEEQERALGALEVISKPGV
jgi:hypothetical protein